MSDGFAFVSGTCPDCGAPATAQVVDRRVAGGTVRIPGRRRCAALGSCGWTEPQVPKVRMDRLRLPTDR